MALYEVTSEARFREFRKGERFEALLTPEEEARAIKRGAVIVIDPAPPGLRPGSYRLPDGWSTR